jgi:subtilase family serine protease
MRSDRLPGTTSVGAGVGTMRGGDPCGRPWWQALNVPGQSHTRYDGRPQGSPHLRKSFTLLITLTLLASLLLAACSPGGGTTSDTGAIPTKIPTQAPFNNPGATPDPQQSPDPADICPEGLSTISNCLTPHAMRVAYGVESLFEHGFTGKGQTIVDIVSFGSPTLQSDMDAFDKQFGLPPITIKVISPLGPNPPGGTHGWSSETELDVQIIHAIAPDAGIVVLTSPVDETEGTIGLPQFLQLEQYAIDHHLGNIISQSWGASEVTLKDQAGQQEIQQWDAFYKQATTQQGITFFGSSGDNGATDYADLKATVLSPTATTSFPPDDPWVTSVGGTTVDYNGGNVQEQAWSNSGGGFSSFFPEPSYQQLLPAAVQSQLNHRRGVPDVAADADPNTSLAIDLHGQWTLIGGTSASAPLWAAIAAIANQMAGHPLGFINPALYKLGTSSKYTQDFRDITVGNNSVTRKVKVKGYPAVPGWDPVTGLGSPIADKLLPDLIATMQG